MQLLVEAIVVGFILLIISIPVMSIINRCYPDELFPSKKKFYVASIIIGMLTHFGFEASGANKWYCENGAACQSVLVESKEWGS
jgi:hypothetical protein